MMLQPGVIAEENFIAFQKQSSSFLLFLGII